MTGDWAVCYTQTGGHGVETCSGSMPTHDAVGMSPARAYDWADLAGFDKKAAFRLAVAGVVVILILEVQHACPAVLGVLVSGEVMVLCLLGRWAAVVA